MRVKLTTCGGVCGQRAKIAVYGMAECSAVYGAVFCNRIGVVYPDAKRATLNGPRVAYSTQSRERRLTGPITRLVTQRGMR
jgi:hypothetical protein